jgi:hypothetical protein
MTPSETGPADHAAAPAHPEVQKGTKHKEHKFRHLLLTAIVLASIVHCLHGFLDILETPFFSWAANTAAWEHGPAGNIKLAEKLHQLAIVKLDEARYNAPPHAPNVQAPGGTAALARNRTGYGGASPLDRCQLQMDLKEVLSNEHLQTVAIDFDLSPSPRTDRPDERDCQATLDKLLDEKATKNAGTLKILLINPGVANPEHDLGAEQRKWKSKREASGVLFGDATLHPELGIVWRSVAQPGTLRFGKLLHDQLAGHGAEEKAPGLLNCCEGAEAHYPIAYNLLPTMLYDGGVALLLCDAPGGLCDDSDTAGQPVKAAKDLSTLNHVIIGPGYTADDEHLTPLGLLSGVEVHAAIAIDPDREGYEFLGYGLDILMGMAAAVLVGWCWRAYFRQSLADESLAYVWVVVMAAGFALAGYGSAVIGVWTYSRWGLWINPVPMLVGMALDTWILGSVHAAVHVVHDSLQHSNAAPSARCTMRRIPGHASAGYGPA